MENMEIIDIRNCSVHLALKTLDMSMEKALMMSKDELLNLWNDNALVTYAINILIHYKVYDRMNQNDLNTVIMQKNKIPDNYVYYDLPDPGNYVNVNCPMHVKRNRKSSNDKKRNNAIIQ